MKIETLSAVNLKVPSFNYTFGSVNVVCGNNFVGKSAVLQAIQWLLLGYVPGISKTNAGIFSLSAGSQMAGTIKMTDGVSIHRSLEQRGETVKASESITPKGFAVPDCLLDVGTYLNSSDRERVKFVFSLVSIEETWSGGRILKLIGETPIDCEKEIVEAVVLAKRKIFESLSESDMARHDADESVQSWLESVLEDLRERVRNTTAALGRMEKYSQAAVELRSNGNGHDAANVDRLLKEKREALRLAGESLAVAKSKVETAKQNQATRSELNRRLSEPWSETAVETTRQQIKEIGPRVENHKSDLSSLAAKVAEAKGQLEAARAMEKKLVSEITALNRQHDLDVKAPKCPHCGSKGKKFKDAIEEQFAEKMAELEKGKHKTAHEIADALKAWQESGEAYQTTAIADQKAQQDRMILQSAKAELNRLETLAQNRAMWQKQLDGLTAVEAPAQSDIFEMTKQIALLETEVTDLTDRQKRWVANAHEAKRQAEAKAQRQVCESELIALKAVVKSVEVIQSAIVEDAFGKILADANRFCDGILLTNLAYHDGEIGRWSGSVWIPHRSFSGTEQLVSCAGISVALARQSPIKLVLLDELGRLTAANKERLVDRLLSLTQDGFIDQAVCVDVSREPYAMMDGINLIEI